MHWIGDIAGIATAVLWSVSAVSWSVAGRRIGSVPVAAIRLVIAIGMLMAIRTILYGSPWPAQVRGESLALLMASGLLGTCISDLFLFRSLVLLGPRNGMLIQAIGPIITSVIAWIGFGETLGWRAAVGVAMTVGGVMWVLAEQKSKEQGRTAGRQFAAGVAMAMTAVFIVSFGYVLSRLALTGGPRHFSSGPPLTAVAGFDAAVIRVGTAAVGVWLLLPLIGRLRATLGAFREVRSIGVVTVGTITGPAVGIWTSLVALAHSKAGVATALINLTPLVLIAVVWLVYGERPSARTLLGTVLAVAGVFVLAIRGG